MVNSLISSVITVDTILAERCWHAQSTKNPSL